MWREEDATIIIIPSFKTQWHLKSLKWDESLAAQGAMQKPAEGVALSLCLRAVLPH